MYEAIEILHPGYYLNERSLLSKFGAPLGVFSNHRQCFGWILARGAC